MKNEPFEPLEEFVGLNFSQFWNKKERKPIVLDKESKEKLDELAKKIIRDFKLQKQQLDESTNQG